LLFHKIFCIFNDRTGNSVDPEVMFFGNCPDFCPDAGSQVRAYVTGLSIDISKRNAQIFRSIGL